MDTNDLISIQRLCKHYKISNSFISKLNEYELIEIIESKNELYIYKTQITEVEKMIRLHFELNINMEGMDAIYNLMRQIDSLKNDILQLNNKLQFYEK